MIRETLSSSALMMTWRVGREILLTATTLCQSRAWSWGHTPAPGIPVLFHLCSLLGYTWTLQVLGEFRTIPELQHLHFCQAMFGSSIFGNTHEALGCRWVLFALHSSGIRCPSAHLPHKHHRDTSHQLLLKCLLRLNFGTMDWNTMSRGVEYF